jgi:hypothetical protein
MGEKVWQNRFHSEKLPTLDSVVIQAEDVVKTKDIYQLVVCHVLFIAGHQGFLYSIRCTDGNIWSPIEDGEAYLGTDRKTWLNVKREGVERFEQILRERTEIGVQWKK